MDITKDPTFVYTEMVGYHPKPLTIVVVGHFLAEYLLSEIISKKCKDPKKIIKYSFLVKVEFLNAMNLLPEDLYNNIRNLNKIRNEIVHSLNINLKDRDFFKSSGEKITIRKPKSGDPERHYLKMLSLGILISLRNICFYH